MDIKNKISSRGYTLQQVADALGITQQAVSAAVNGNPSLSRLKDIATFLGISVSELLADEESKDEIIIKCDKCGNVIKYKRVDG